MIKRISWITPEAFIDVDLPIINFISDDYDINWLVVIGVNAKINYEEYVNGNLKSSQQAKTKFIYLKERARSLKMIKNYYKIITLAKSFKPDIYYTSFYGAPYALFLYRLLLPLKQCVVACHNVTTPQGASNEGFMRRYTHLWLSTFKNIQVFSQNQYHQLTSKYSNKNVLLAHLAIKDYGEPNHIVDKNNERDVRFLFFGNILNYKRVDLLIEAGNRLVEKGIKNFKIRIAGSCKNWEEYNKLIKYPDFFELNIERIPNEKVADLFADSHYFVMPYQDIAQSGAITVAFRYNLPVLCSDIDQFKEFVNIDVGFFFQSLNVEDLTEKMLYMISNHNNIYDDICIAEKQFIDRKFSLKAITNKYKNFFEQL